MRRPPISRASLAAVLVSTLLATAGNAQPTDPFQLNAVQQAYLDQVLSSWEIESGKVTTFNCPFTRWDYNAFGPARDIAFSVDEGQVSYQQPDKGSFRITQISRWVPKPVAPGQAPPQGAPQGQHVVQPDAIGEHWVCDGRSVFEFKHDQKVLRVQPIPPALQGKAIVDGPLPFLFGAKAEKLKQKYRMFIKEPPPSPEIIQIVAQPRTQELAANYRGVELQLDKRRMLPVGMQVWQPDGSRSVYLFDLERASVNARRDRLWGAIFQSPRTPRGWKRVDEPLPTRQAAAPAQPAR
ncbi:MAG: hypothetical protein AAF596_07175 [Planctomycetota bacterium]